MSDLTALYLNNNKTDGENLEVKAPNVVLSRSLY